MVHNEILALSNFWVFLFEDFKLFQSHFLKPGSWNISSLMNFGLFFDVGFQKLGEIWHVAKRLEAVDNMLKAVSVLIKKSLQVKFIEVVGSKFGNLFFASPFKEFLFALFKFSFFQNGTQDS